MVLILDIIQSVPSTSDMMIMDTSLIDYIFIVEIINTTLVVYEQTLTWADSNDSSVFVGIPHKYAWLCFYYYHNFIIIISFLNLIFYILFYYGYLLLALLALFMP